MASVNEPRRIPSAVSPAPAHGFDARSVFPKHATRQPPTQPGQFARRLKSLSPAADDKTEATKHEAQQPRIDQDEDGGFFGLMLDGQLSAAQKSGRAGAARNNATGEEPKGQATASAAGNADERRRLSEREGDDGREKGASDQAELDPLARHLSHLTPFELQLGSAGPPLVTTTPSAQAAALPPALSSANLDEILSRMVTKFALSGDKNRGTSHMVVGSGELAGGAITLEAEGKAVRVRIDAPPGVDARAFGEGIRTRLEARGLEPTIEVV
jgi:hypothetical protein